MKRKLIITFCITTITIIAFVGIAYIFNNRESVQSPVYKQSPPIVQSTIDKDVFLDVLELKPHQQEEPQKKEEVRKSFGKNTLVISSDHILTLVDENGKEKVIREKVRQVTWSLDGTVFVTEGVWGDFTSGLYSKDGALIAEIPGYSGYVRPSPSGKYVAYVDLTDNEGYKEDWFTGIRLYSAETDDVQVLTSCVASCNIVGVGDDGTVYYNDTQEQAGLSRSVLSLYRVSPSLSKENISGDVSFKYNLYQALYTRDFSKIYWNNKQGNQLYIFTRNNGMEPQLEIEEGVSFIQWKVPNEVLEIEHIDDTGAKTVEYRNIQ